MRPGQTQQLFVITGNYAISVAAILIAASVVSFILCTSVVIGGILCDRIACGVCSYILSCQHINYFMFMCMCA